MPWNCPGDASGYRIGARVARYGHALGMQVVAHRRSAQPAPGVSLLDADALFSTADVLVACLPGGAETYRFIDYRRMALLNDDAILVNVWRGSTLNTDDLAQTLLEGRLSGVGLDVTEPEPLPSDHPLRGIERVLLTRHVGGYSDHTNKVINRRFRANVMDFVAAGASTLTE